MPARTIAIGDIHGCAAALEAVLESIQPQPVDTIIVLGDYVDRGPASRQVIDRLIELGARCRLVTLIGNHEEMLLLAREDEIELAGWLEYGGAETLESYGVDHPRDLPTPHIDFITAGKNYFEAPAYFFVHANYLSDAPLERQPIEVLRWESLWQRVPARHRSGKTGIVGHTAQHSGEVWDLGHLKCIDTYCHGGGWLTALEPATGALWQADREGRLRPERV